MGLAAFGGRAVPMLLFMRINVANRPDQSWALGLRFAPGGAMEVFSPERTSDVVRRAAAPVAL